MLKTDANIEFCHQNQPMSSTTCFLNDTYPIIQTSIIFTYDTFGIPLLNACPRVLTARKEVIPRATRAGATVNFIQNPIHDINTHIAAGKNAQIK